MTHVNLVVSCISMQDICGAFCGFTHFNVKYLMSNMCDASLGFHPFLCKIYVMFFWWFHSFQCKIYVMLLFGFIHFSARYIYICDFIHFNAKYKWCFFVVSFISVQDICDVFLVVSFISEQDICDAFLWFHPFQCKIYVMLLSDFIYFNARYMLCFLWFHPFQCDTYHAQAYFHRRNDILLNQIMLHIFSWC